MEFNPSNKNLGLGLLTSGILFSVYSETNIGNVWYRHDSSGEKTFSLSQLGKFIARPFHNKDMWKKETILNNSIIFAGLTTYPISVLLEYQQTFKRFF